MATEGGSAATIAKQAAHGVAWNMLFGVGSRVLTLVSTLILTRFYTPEAYGDAITASIVVLTASAFTSFAFGQYLIAKRATPEVAAQAMVLHVGIGVAAMAATYLLRHQIAAALDSPRMPEYVWGFAIAQLIDRARYVPERLIMRALRFRTLATINGVGELVFASAALATAPSSGAYAVMFAWMARSTATSILFFYAAPRDEWLVRVRLRAADLRDLMLYGLPIMVATATDNATRRWDNLVVTKLFGSGVMAHYQLAYSLAEMPIINVAEHIGEVLMPSFSRMADGEREDAAVRAAGLMGLVVSPLGVGLGAVASTVTATFFNKEWGPMMAPMLTILSIMTVFRPMTWSAIAYVQSVQRTRIVMWSSFLRAIAVLSCVGLFGYLGGPNWACIGAGIAFALHAVVTIIATGAVTSLKTSAYLRNVARPLLPCVPMFIGVELVERGLHALGAPNLVSLIVQVVAGGILYIAAAFVLVRSSVDEVLRLGRGALRKRRG